jgi:hypothetical protein
VDTQTDADHCSACGNACPLTNDVCVGGACDCPASLPDECGSSCVNRQTDEANCGTCGTDCPSGSTCESGTCQCASGSTPCGTTCCPGNACCGGTGCQTAHLNGLGQTYFDCGALDTHTRGQAILAAAAWSASGTDVDGTTGCGPSCFCRQTATQAAIWCYIGSAPAQTGKVFTVASPNCFAVNCSSGGLSWR